MAICRRVFLASAGAAMLAPTQVLAQSASTGAARALVATFSYFDMPGNHLPNTLADGRLMTQTLQRLGFNAVTAIEDGTARAALTRIGAFVDELRSGELGLVYFACHGIQVADENLVVLPGGEAFLSLRSLIDALRARTDTVIVLLDACRNNPFQEVPEEAQVSRALGRSMAGGARDSFVTLDLNEVTAGDMSRAGTALRPFSLQGSGVKIVFATDPNNVALDGATPASVNSPFAQSLSRRLLERRSLDDVISMTTGDVIQATDGQQSPWSQGSIDRPIFLAGMPRQRNPSRPRFQVPG